MSIKKKQSLMIFWCRQVDIIYVPSEIVAMHCIPGKDGSPRPILIKFLRIDTIIALLRKKREINEPLKVKIGNDITKLNQGLLHILYLLVYTKRSSVIVFF
jgi:hypothetical protein